ncbi:MAG: hypothetical protein GYA86_07140 [Firmicutes bacterium]|nr:hypothetical protein [Bacillota bacterium]
MDHLRSALVSYRMVFGQPRQGDLLNFLSRCSREAFEPGKLVEYRIDLSPPEEFGS